MDTAFFWHDYEKVRTSLFCRLMRADRIMLLRQIVCVRAFADLCAVPCIFMAEPGKIIQGSPLTFAQIQAWKIEPAQLIRDAVNNMQEALPATLETMGDLMESSRGGSVRSSLLSVLKRNFPDTPEGKLDQVARILARRIGQRAQETGGLKPMWVLGNTAGRYGSSSVLYPGVLERFAQKLKSSFYILPSSVNDVILLPEGGAETREMLYEMVASANRSMEDAKMVLSDSVYYFDGKNMEIRLF